MRRLRTIGCLLAAALLAGCVANSSSSGSTSSPPPASGVTVAPADARVAAGQTQQFNATVSGNAKAAVVWQVNGVTGGKADIGTISTSGVYTAPTLPPAGGKVTVTAVAKSDSTLKGSATATLQYSDASLQGTWVFTYRNENLGVIGRFRADGKGGITAGSEDVNAPDGVFLKLPFDGSYTVAADGTGEAAFVSERGEADFRFVIGASGRARFIRTDSGGAGAGDMLRQNADVGGDASVTGDYVFKLSDPRTAIVGRFSADGAGGIADAVQDRNTAGAVTTGIPFDAAYTVDDAGRGTMTLTNVFGTMHYVFYVVAPDTIRLLSADPAQVRTGRALMQTAGAFDDSDLTGNYAFYLAGGTGAATAGLLHADGAGNIDSGEFDSSGTATVQPLALTGTYAIDGTGRGTARLLTPTGQTDLIFYLQSADRALTIEADSAAERNGRFLAQSDDTFSESSLDGSFVLTSDTTASAQQTVVGQVVLDGNGNIDGVEAAAAGGSGSTAIALGGSYTLDKDGRGTLTLLTEGGGPQDFVFYAVSPQKLLLVGFDPAAAAFSRLRQRW